MGLPGDAGVRTARLHHSSVHPLATATSCHAPAPQIPSAMAWPLSGRPLAALPLLPAAFLHIVGTWSRPPAPRCPAVMLSQPLPLPALSLRP